MQGVFLDTAKRAEAVDVSGLGQALPHWAFYPITRPGQVVENIHAWRQGGLRNHVETVAGET